MRRIVAQAFSVTKLENPERTIHFRFFHMPTIVIRCLIALGLTLAAVGALQAALLAPASTPAPMADRVDWAGFLARNDLTWNQTPINWIEGPFRQSDMDGKSAWEPKPSVVQEGPLTLAWQPFNAGVVNLQPVPRTGPDNAWGTLKTKPAPAQ
jgi:hypothetical protein